MKGDRVRIGMEMVLVIALSVMVSALTTRIVAAYYFKVIDSHVNKCFEMMKDFVISQTDKPY